MTALTRARTTIGQLVYASLPEIDFPRLVADLETALAASEIGKRRLTFHGDRMAMIDAGSSRVTVALAEGLDAEGAAAVIVTVGYAPIMDGDLRLARRRTVLARLIAERVVESFAPVETIWTDSEEEATPELIERLIEGLAARRQVSAEAVMAQIEARRMAPRHFVEPEDLPRIMARVDASLAARKSGRSLAMAAEGGRASLDISDLARIKRATENTQAKASAPMRLAAHMIDATLMVVALPVGAAMMVYSLSRGADINISARALAISGVGIGLLHSMGAGGILGSLLTRGI